MLSMDLSWPVKFGKCLLILREMSDVCGRCECEAMRGP